MSLSVDLLSRGFSRFAGLALILAALLVLSGCWVSSINALYDEGTWDHPHKDPDVVLDRGLIGFWTVTDKKCATVLTVALEKDVYDLQSTEEGEGCDEDKSHRRAKLVKLGTHYFLDIEPLPDDVCDMCAAKHDILLAKFDMATLSLTPMDSDWLKKSIETKRVKLATVTGDTDTITASTKDLKAFFRKFAENKEAFKPESTDTLTRKPAS
jgi:hypothetical protein